MSNGVKFPDILKHENENYAIVDSNDVRGFYITELRWSDFQPISITEGRRKTNYIVVAKGSLYQYYGNTVDDSDWGEKSNWLQFGIADEGRPISTIHVYPNKDVIKEQCLCEDEPFVACTKTGRIYKFLTDGTEFDNEGEDATIETAQGGSTRYVDIVIYNLSDSFLSKSANLSDVADRQTAINNLTNANKEKAGKFLYVDTEGNAVYKEIGNPMRIKGRVDTYEDLPVEEVNIGDVYLVGEEESQNFEEYVCTENEPIIKWENLGHVKYQSDWNQTNPLADDYIKNKPTGLMKFINEVETYDDLPSDAIVGSVYSIKEEVEVYDDITRESIGVYPPSTNFVKTETGWESLGGYISYITIDRINEICI